MGPREHSRPAVWHGTGLFVLRHGDYDNKFGRAGAKVFIDETSALGLQGLAVELPGKLAA